MNVMFFKIRIRPGIRKDILESAAGLLEPARFESECTDVQIYQARRDKALHCLVGVWSTRRAMERYIRSEEFRRLLVLTELLEDPATVGFIVDAKNLGLEYVREVLALDSRVDP
jgi:quinol monooxygenase YgiN